MIYGNYPILSAMEDAHAAVLDLDGLGESNAFFAIYDGHGGVFLSSTIFLEIPISVIRIFCSQICWSKCAQTIGHRRELQGTKLGNGTQEGISRD